MNNQILQLYEDFNSRLWRDDMRDVRGWRRVLIFIVRLAVVLARHMVKGQLNLRAMSLVYTTLLSLVPLLAVRYATHSWRHYFLDELLPMQRGLLL